ncbi:MAG TPA: TIGR00266 family protein [Dehalococcoidia bacterium]
MDFEIRYQPAYALAIVRLSAGETISAETGAMVSMSDSIQLQTAAKGGLLSGLRRSVLGGESFFINTFKAEAPGEVTLAPALPGDVVHYRMSGGTLLVQSGSYLASTGDIQVDTKWGGAKTFFSGEGLFLLRVTGTGDLFLSSYGAIHPVDLAAGQRYVVDTGHVVAFEEGVAYQVRRAGSWKSTFFGGEGLVVELTGPGRAHIQTRSPASFLSWLVPKLPGKRE